MSIMLSPIEAISALASTLQYPTLGACLSSALAFQQTPRFDTYRDVINMAGRYPAIRIPFPTREEQGNVEFYRTAFPVLAGQLRPHFDQALLASITANKDSVNIWEAYHSVTSTFSYISSVAIIESAIQAGLLSFESARQYLTLLISGITSELEQIPQLPPRAMKAVPPIRSFYNLWRLFDLHPVPLMVNGAVVSGTLAGLIPLFLGAKMDPALILGYLFAGGGAGFVIGTVLELKKLRDSSGTTEAEDIHVRRIRVGEDLLRYLQPLFERLEAPTP